MHLSVRVYVIIGMCPSLPELTGRAVRRASHTTGAGEVGLRLSNQGVARATITEVYLVDEAGLLRPETARVEGTGQVHFRKATKCASQVKPSQGACRALGCFFSRWAVFFI